MNERVQVNERVRPTAAPGASDSTASVVVDEPRLLEHQGVNLWSNAHNLDAKQDVVADSLHVDEKEASQFDKKMKEKTTTASSTLEPTTNEASVVDEDVPVRVDQHKYASATNLPTEAEKDAALLDSFPSEKTVEKMMQEAEEQVATELQQLSLSLSI